MHTHTQTHTYQYILTICILININLLNLNNNLLMFLCVCGYKNNRFIVNSNQRPNNSVTTESFEVNFFPNMVTKQFNTSSSNEIYKVSFFQTGYG